MNLSNDELNDDFESQVFNVENMNFTFNEIVYLKILFQRYEEDIENDILHCELGAEDLKQKLDLLTML